MDVQQYWPAICETVNRGLKRSGYCSVATVNPDGAPNVSPIGSIILGEAGKAIYFEQFLKNTRRNLDQDERICVLAVANGFLTFFKALFKGRFDAPPGVKLMGRVGARRVATDEELKQWQTRIKRFRRLKGYQLLWKDMHYVREVTFETWEPLRLGAMGRGLWEGAD